MHIFEKLPLIFWALSNRKISFHPRKIEPPKTFGGPPQPKNPACITAGAWRISQKYDDSCNGKLQFFQNLIILWGIWKFIAKLNKVKAKFTISLNSC